MKVFRYILALTIIFVNFFLRLSSRPLAATNMRISALLHPLYLVPPGLLLFSYYNSYVSPVCRLPFVNRDEPKGPELAWQSFTFTWPNDPFPDVIITSVWLVAYVFWALSQVKPPKFDDDSEV